MRHLSARRHIVILTAMALGASACVAGTAVLRKPQVTAPVSAPTSAVAAARPSSKPREPSPATGSARAIAKEPRKPLPATPVARAVEEAAPGATVGVLVHDRRSGADRMRLQADRQFRSASLVKLLIAVDYLQRNGTPDDAEAAELRRMLSLSDDDVASRLWVEGGGDGIVDRTVRRLRLTGTEPPDIPGRWGNVLLTASDVVRIYRYILDELPADQRELIVSALADAPRRAADGWDQYFGIPDGIGGRFAVKQGWSNSGDDCVVHTTGLLGKHHRFIVAVLVGGSCGLGWDRLRAASTAAARAITPMTR